MDTEQTPGVTPPDEPKTPAIEPPIQEAEEDFCTMCCDTHGCPECGDEPDEDCGMCGGTGECPECGGGD